MIGTGKTENNAFPTTPLQPSVGIQKFHVRAFSSVFMSSDIIIGYWVSLCWESFVQRPMKILEMIINAILPKFNTKNAYFLKLKNTYVR